MRLLLAGLFLSRFVANAYALTPDQWKQDIVTLRTAISAHPNPFYKTPKENFERKADSLAADLEKLQDFEVVARMAELVAMLNDGHTRLTMPVVKNAGLSFGHSDAAPAKIQAFGHFPIRFVRAADGFVVTRASEEYKDLLGAQLLSIEGKSIQQVDSALRPLVQGDNEYQREYLLSNFLVIPKLLAAVGVAPNRDRSSWAFKLADGKQVTRNVVSVRADTPTEWSYLNDSLKPHRNQRHWFEKRADGLIYARLTDILNDQDETVPQFAESLFAEVDATPNATLVLDLRDNPGGDNTFDDAIVRGAIRSKKLWEPGRFFVVTNPGTFSAATNLTVLLERWTPAIFIGQPTGGAPNGYGDPKLTVLPNSGLSLLVSSVYWQLSTPKDTRDSVLPLLPIEPTVASLRAGQDPAMNLVASTFRKPESTTGNFSGQCAAAGKMRKLDFQIKRDQLLMTAPDFKMEAQPLENVKRHDDLIEGSVKIGDQTVAIHGRIASRYFLGWVELSGRPYSFTTQLE